MKALGRTLGNLLRSVWVRFLENRATEKTYKTLGPILFFLMALASSGLSWAPQGLLVVSTSSVTSRERRNIHKNNRIFMVK